MIQLLEGNIQLNKWFYDHAEGAWAKVTQLNPIPGNHDYIVLATTKDGEPLSYTVEWWLSDIDHAIKPQPELPDWKPRKGQ